MKAVSKIVKSKPVKTPPPTLDNITLQLSGREAFLICAALGGQNSYEQQTISNKGREGMNLSDYPNSVTGEISVDDSNDFYFRLYDRLTEILEEAKNEGVE